MKREDLVEIRIHGRGGQGAVSAATLAAEVAFKSGYYPQAFPFFGAERRGAPVMAFLRYSSSSLMPRCRIYKPKYVVVFDSELPAEGIVSGLKEEGGLLINASTELPSAYADVPVNKIYQVDASQIAADHGLIASGMPLVSSVMLGALIRILDLSSLNVLEETLMAKMAHLAEENVKGARRGYNEVKEVLNSAYIQ